MEWIRTKQIAQNTKSRQNLWQVQTHLTGALACAEAVKGKLAFGFYDLLQWPHDSNLTICVLLSIIQQLPKRIPEVLYLQLDNCFQENKNKYLLGFFALLVKLKVFQKVWSQLLLSIHNSGPLAICTHTHTIHVQTLECICVQCYVNVAPWLFCASHRSRSTSFLLDTCTKM